MRLALAARLQAHQDVAGVLRRRKQAQLRAGAPGIRRDFGRLGDHLLDRPDLAIGFRERAAGRRQVVDDEAALVRRRERIRCRSTQNSPAVSAASRTATTTATIGRPIIDGEQARVGPVEARRAVRQPDDDRSRAQRASSGTMVIDSASDSSTATDRLSDSARKNCPGTPESRPAARTRPPSSASS